VYISRGVVLVLVWVLCIPSYQLLRIISAGKRGEAVLWFFFFFGVDECF
jgi:hypothetical protein